MRGNFRTEFVASCVLRGDEWVIDPNAQRKPDVFEMSSSSMLNKMRCLSFVR